MAENNISSSLEDYLEAIAEITADNGHAHTKDIAERLKVKMPSVTNALRQLAGRGLIHYESHAPVVLTPAGEARAAAVQQRHTTLQNFFRDVLKVDEQSASDCACKIEHVIGEEVRQRVAVLARAIAERPDCAELRRYLEETMPGIHASQENLLCTLDQLQPGQRGLVTRVDEKLPGARRLTVMGLIKNAEVEMEGRAPFGDLLRLKLLGSSITLRAGDAEHVLVKPV